MSIADITGPTAPRRWVERVSRSIKGSDTPHTQPHASGRPARRAHTPRTRDPRTDGRRPLQPTHQRALLPQPQDRRDARAQHLHKTRPPRIHSGQPPRTRRARVPPSVTNHHTHETAAVADCSKSTVAARRRIASAGPLLVARSASAGRRLHHRRPGFSYLCRAAPFVVQQEREGWRARSPFRTTSSGAVACRCSSSSSSKAVCAGR